METRIIQKSELHAWLRALRPSAVIGVLLTGDRLSCCDETVAIIDDSGQIVGVATIAPHGEEGSSQPTIVALYIRPSARGQGLAKPLQEATIRRCLERGFKKIRVDVMSARMMKVINSLSSELRDVLEVYDLVAVMDLLAGMESE